MTLFRSKPLRASLCVGRQDSRLFWSLGDHGGGLAIPSEESSPKAILQQALSSLRQQVEQIGISTQHVRWRICVLGGFYAPAQRPAGRWSTVLATAAANDLEHVCPVPLDELHTSAIPINPDKAWVCGFDKAVLSEWKAAADELEIALEGVWSHAAALVDFFLESGSNAPRSLRWQDGFTRVELWPAEDSISQCIDRIRVYAWREPAEAAGIQEFIAQNAPADLVRDCPIPALPGAALHLLHAIDSSESLNLLHSSFRSSALEHRIQRPFASALMLCSVAFLILALGYVVSGQTASREAQSAQAQLAASWHQIHGPSPLPPLAVTTMEQEAANWRTARAELPSFDARRPGTMAAWAMLVENLPKDLPVSVSSLRNHQGEMWIEGQVKSPGDARKLESAWDGIGALTADPMRLSAGSGGLVSFSMRMLLR
ncbi:MAG TPA: hypothetical protein VM008_12020 [Phycisphaerae bacterium]|nr:hypothetical protein [Phycisphaerae bacterium]